MQKNNKERYLAKYATKSSFSKGRIYKEKENSIVVQTKPEEKFVKAELSHDEFMIFMNIVHN